MKKLKKKMVINITSYRNLAYSAYPGLILWCGLAFPYLQILIVGFLVDMTQTAARVDAEWLRASYDRAKNVDVIFVALAVILAFEFRLFPGIAMMIENMVDIFYLGVLATFSL